ncbi:hypothetical protein VP01_3915g3 [Puccinia sorghi]|uniref:Uncharacterized protein n=1 Tax=Puccinia sorghi TaxID=27349 RepID=A0A0L6UUJ4_9BASI|nr:hypothetical protein VP01_3915g3 [Puccinia sorghi]
MTDEEELLMPRGLCRHQFFEGARDSFLGPRDEMPAGLPTNFTMNGELCPQLADSGIWVGV